MKIKIKRILLFLIFLNFSTNDDFYSPYEVFNFLELQLFPKEDLDNIKETVSKILYDFYAFYEIAKSPPQPEFDKNYYNRVDLKKEISEIKTENVSFYNFYRSILKPMARTKDGHFYQNFMYLNLILGQFTVVFPFRLELGEHNGQQRIFCNHSFRDNINISFKIDYETINKTISKNKEVPIKTINDKIHLIILQILLKIIFI